MNKLFTTAREIHEELKNQRNQTLKELRKEFPKGILPSRGTVMFSMDEKGYRDDEWFCSSYPSKKIIDDFIKDNPKAKEIWIENGYDHAESLYAYREYDDYIPQVGFADVLICKQ